MILMKAADPDIFHCPKNEKDTVIITTNGIVKANGCAVMGAGIAKSARDSFPGIDRALGKKLKTSGNQAYDMGTYRMPDTGILARVLTMPTKQDWKNDSDLNLIRQSATQLMNMVFHDPMSFDRIYMPRPGCTNGKRRWEDVKPVIEPILDDHFVIVTPI